MRDFDELLDECLTPEQIAQVEEEARKEVALIKIRKLRKIRNFSQGEMAKAMGISQPALSKLERRSNVTVNTLIDYVAALGGRLKIQAEFGDNAVDILTAERSEF